MATKLLKLGYCKDGLDGPVDQVLAGHLWARLLNQPFTDQ